MQIFERVQALCADHNISIARLERETGLGNATVRGWQSTAPALRRSERSLITSAAPWTI